jgi:hypothetical protein
VSNYHHKQLKRFSLDGIIHDESAISRLKTEYIRLLVSEMKLTGYVPRFDIDIDFTLDYNKNKKYFEFELSIYAVYTGRRKSEWIAGIDGTKPIFIPKNKSKESLREQV